MAVGTPDRIEGLILKQLASKEMRLLTLVVALRRSLAGPVPFKGDLGRAAEAALRRLQAARLITDTGGVFSLCTPHKTEAGSPA